ncbi:MAG: hypothetical protein J6V07_00755 [Clostridia bacterium]|nr:hypothetical protein [Clostridia bacterium]
MATEAARSARCHSRLGEPCVPFPTDEAGVIGVALSDMKTVSASPMPSPEIWFETLLARRREKQKY